MPNIRSQSLTREGLTIVASDGTTFSMTRAEAVAIFQSKQGTRGQRLVSVAQDVKAAIVAAFGSQISLADIGIDFDLDNADVNLRGWRSIVVGSARRVGLL